MLKEMLLKKDEMHDCASDLQQSVIWCCMLSVSYRIALDLFYIQECLEIAS
jgi:hypothetical protein